MADLGAIFSVGESVRLYLAELHRRELPTGFDCSFELLSSGELAALEEKTATVSLYLYRVTANEHLRNRGRESRFESEIPPLALDLHYLLTVWSNSALLEQTLLAWAMSTIHRRPVLDASSLTQDGGWGPDDTVHLIPAELSTEDLMRVWDALAPSYRLSVSYIARVVRIDPPEAVATEHAPVVARRSIYRDPPLSGRPGAGGGAVE
jgi:hypothetical protein